MHAFVRVRAHACVYVQVCEFYYNSFGTHIWVILSRRIACGAFVTPQVLELRIVLGL